MGGEWVFEGTDKGSGWEDLTVKQLSPGIQAVWPW